MALFVKHMSKSKVRTPLFDRLLGFAKSNTATYPQLYDALNKMNQFVGFDDVKEAVTKQIQYFISHHLAQLPSRRSTRKRRSATMYGRSKRVCKESDAEDSDDDNDAETDNILRIFARAIAKTSSDSESDDDEDWEEDEETKKCGERLKLLEGHFIHTMLIGPPGTGKTSFAKILANVWAALGIVDGKKFMITRRSDWIGNYTGQSVNKAKKVIQKARGGVIFIDEAYSLIADEKQDMYGYEVLTEICEAMSSPVERQVLFIFAGYENEMKKIFQANTGLKRRFGYIFKFPKPNIGMLMEIFLTQLKRDKWKMKRAERIRTAELFQSHQHELKHSGGSTQQLLFHAKQHAVMNSFPQPLKKYLTADDVKYAFKAKTKHHSFMENGAIVKHMYI